MAMLSLYSRCTFVIKMLCIFSAFLCVFVVKLHVYLHFPVQFQRQLPLQPLQRHSGRHTGAIRGFCANSAASADRPVSQLP